MPYLINCSGKLLDLSYPRVMGIINITPDSFYDGGKFLTGKTILDRAREIVKEGGEIIDIGGCSTRPGSLPVSMDEEMRRVIPAITLVHLAFPEVIISVDTFRSEVARSAIENGAAIVNDISSGMFDEKMFDTVASLKVPYVLMHIQGAPENMQERPVYKDVVKEIINYFIHKINRLRQHGVADIIIDPGFGFGKTLQHNYEILNHLNDFQIFDLPLMAGISRKSMVNKVLGIKPDEALNGTTVLNTIALLHGVNILRVHDVKEAVEAVKLVQRMVGKPSCKVI